jgi:hypothetical protein
VALLIKALAGALVVVVIQLLARSRTYYIAGMVPPIPDLRPDLSLCRRNTTDDCGAAAHDPLWHPLAGAILGLPCLALLPRRPVDIAGITPGSGLVLGYRRHGPHRRLGTDGRIEQ